MGATRFTILKKLDVSQLKGKSINIALRDGAQAALLWHSSAMKNAPLIIEIHGGGFCYNSNKDDDNICAILNKELGYNVASLNYRLAPKFKYPTAINDCFDQVEALLTSSAFDFDRKNVFLFGHSAGGNLAAALSILYAESGKIKAQALSYPVLDNVIAPKERPKRKYALPKCLMKSFIHKYCPDKTKRKDILLSPLLANENIVQKLPTTFILTCEYDSLKVDGERFAILLTQNKVDCLITEYKDTAHGFIEIYAKNPHPRKCWSKPMKKLLPIRFAEAISDVCTFFKNNESR